MPQEPATNKPKRIPVDYLYTGLNWDFIKLLAKVAHYASEKYGSATQYGDGPLEGEKDPINHIYEHLRQFLSGEPHDRFGDRAYHLAAIAYNAMMAFLYLRRGWMYQQPHVLFPHAEVKDKGDAGCD